MIHLYLFRQKFSLSTGASQTLINVIGNYSSAFMAALAIIYISRSLGPTIFGEFSAAFSLSIVVAKINDVGITIASQKFASQTSKNSEAKAFIYYGYKLKFFFSILIIALGLLVSPYLTKLFNFSHILIVPISVIFGVSVTYYDQLVITLLAIHSFVRASLVNFTQATFKLVTSVIVLFFYPKQLIPLLMLFLFAPAFPLLFKSIFEPSWYKNIKKIEVSKKNRIKFLKLSKHSAILVLSSGIIDYIGVLFVKNFLNSYEAGLLGGISRIALLFSLVGISLSQVLYNRVSKYKQKNDLDIFIKKAYALSLGAVVLYLLTLPFLSIVTELSIGSEYLVALKPLTILLASVFVHIISIPFMALFYSFDKDSYFSTSGILQLFLIIIGNLILIPQYGILGSALAQLLSRVVLLLFTVALAYNTYKEKFSNEE